MVTLRSKAPIENAPTEHGFEVAEKHENGGTRKVSEYEKSREERIRENLERMQKLGILDLSLKVRSLNKPSPKSTPSIRRTLEHSTPLPPSGPRRRSSRLQNATPVNYSEVQLTKKENLLGDELDLLTEEGSKPEFYTEEHENLLGSTEMSWTLFVDGYGESGKRIYDPVNGKTCHQCRQKTLGYRTHCCKCNKVQGQFCGDCLYMRYGEHVLEANQNPNWICPVCRGICNCSLCRQAKGWAPTGPLYKKISRLGFRSVAHYIIQTRREGSDSEPTSDSKVPISAKRSLPFSNTEETSTENESSECKTEAQVADNCIHVGKQEEKPHFLDNEKADRMLNLEENLGLVMQPAFATIGDSIGTSDVIRNERDFHECSNIPLENNTEPLNKLELPEPSSDQKGTIAKKLDDKEDEGICHFGKTKVGCFSAQESSSKAGAIDESPDVEQLELSCAISPCTVEATMNDTNPATSDVEPVASTDSIARRLRPRRGKGNEQDEQRSTGMQQLKDVSCPLKAESTLNVSDSTEPAFAPMTCSQSNKKRIHVSASSPDSIAGRLRRRCLEGGRVV